VKTEPATGVGKQLLGSGTGTQRPPSGTTEQARDIMRLRCSRQPVANAREKSQVKAQLLGYGMTS